MKKFYLMLMLMIGLSCLSPCLADIIRVNTDDGSVSIISAAPVNPLIRIDGLMSSEKKAGCAIEGIYRGFVLGGYYLNHCRVWGVNSGYGIPRIALKVGIEKLKEEKNLSFSLATRLRLMKRMEIEASYSTKNTVGLTLRYLFGKSLGAGIGYIHVPKLKEEAKATGQTTIASGNEQGDTTEPPLPPVVLPPPPPPPN